MKIKSITIDLIVTDTPSAVRLPIVSSNVCSIIIEMNTNSIIPGITLFLL